MIFFNQIYSKYENFGVPLMRNTETIERPTDQNTITRRYTEEAVYFIENTNDEPFFHYLESAMDLTVVLFGEMEKIFPERKCLIITGTL